MSACAEIRDSGELVRHYFGYVKVISPALHAPDAAVRVLAVENYGLWVNIDRRAKEEGNTGNGAGFGYQHTRREFIPLDCRVVIRAPDRAAIDHFLQVLNEEAEERGGICIIQDKSISG